MVETFRHTIWLGHDQVVQAFAALLVAFSHLRYSPQRRYVGSSELLDGQEKAPPGAAAAGLDEALEYRFELYQAQGMVMVQIGVSLIEALVVLRAYAYSHGRDLDDVARDIVTRALRLDGDRGAHA